MAVKIAATKWKAYTASLARINQRAAEEMIAFASRNGLSDRKALTDYAMALVQKYSEGSAELACEMYDAIAKLQGANVQPAEPAETPDYGEVARSVNGTLKQSPEGNLLGDSVSRLVKRAGADTMLKNAKRDRAEFAWIPSGDSCAFCSMIASRGWQPATNKTVQGDHAEHIHANCQCEFAIRFSPSMDVAGYEPEKLREEYDAAEGDTPQEKVNSMRRANYAEKVSDTVTGARDPNGKAAEKHAILYYEEIRKRIADVPKISAATGYPEDDIMKIKKFLFCDKHDLGGAEPELFKPDYIIAESWRRLQEGKPEAHDLTLLKHEMMEKALMDQGYSQEEAHIKTSKIYNYDKEASEYYGKHKKYREE